MQMKIFGFEYFARMKKFPKNTKIIKVSEYVWDKIDRIKAFIYIKSTDKLFLTSILTDHKVQRIQAEAGFGNGFFEGGLVGL